MEAVARFGKPAMALGVDQVGPQGVESSITRVHDALGRIDVVVANAGYARYGSVLDISARSWERHVAVNLNGTFYVCQSAARVMAKARRGGSIVVTSSSLALVHADDTAAYCTSKSALLALVRSMAAELGVYRIRVNAILPGVVETAMTREMLAGRGFSGISCRRLRSAVWERPKTSPMRRLFSLQKRPGSSPEHRSSWMVGNRYMASRAGDVRTDRRRPSR